MDWVQVWTSVVTVIILYSALHRAANECGDTNVLGTVGLTVMLGVPFCRVWGIL